MDPVTLYAAKYEAMEKATTEQGRRLAHDAGNVAMAVIMSEFGMVKMVGRFFPTEN